MFSKLKISQKIYIILFFVYLIFSLFFIFLYSEIKTDFLNKRYQKIKVLTYSAANVIDFYYLKYNEMKKSITEFNNLTIEISNMIDEQSKSMNNFVEVIANISNSAKENLSSSHEMKNAAGIVANFAAKLEIG